jgi:hypothetical protein
MMLLVMGGKHPAINPFSHQPPSALAFSIGIGITSQLRR